MCSSLEVLKSRKQVSQTSWAVLGRPTSVEVPLETLVTRLGMGNAQALKTPETRP